VISLHGAATWPAQQKNLTGWNRLAEEAGFLVVYPGGRGFPRIWQAMQPGPRLEEDVQFIADLLDHLVSTYNIDRARVYVNGLSNGAGMSSALACTLPDRIAAIGMVATAFILPPDWCPANRPMPVIAFHGTGDPIVPFMGGPLGDPFNPVKTEFPPVRSWIEAWVHRNGCATGPEILQPAPDVTLERYGDCRAAVSFYILDGAGHIWPGGKPLPEWHLGPNSDSVDATRLMWAFFEENGKG
ncbi:MAG: PHB depolymerase family esterase, partial [Candidatus Competibacterales bacterium]|nr:PHB depolymerase family esterase [Candidatus Competibacterales bacterium]